MGVFLALGHDNMPVQASIVLLGLELGRPNHIHVWLLVPLMFMCTIYEETN